MFRFNEFIIESTLSVGKDAVRHGNKYITPYVGQQDTHTLAKPHGSIAANVPVTIHGQINVNGVPHAIVSQAGGKKIKVPFNKINKPTKKLGAKYSDEHAHARIWNHMVGLGIANDRDAMQKEFEKSKRDKKHPLHFDNALDHEGFQGGKKTEAHRNSYYDEHQAAIDTVYAMAQHGSKDMKNAIKNRYHAKVMGADRGEVSDIWKKHGAENGTSKSDLSLMHPTNKKAEGIKLSMKKGGGSQLMSAGPEESSAVHDYAAREMLNTHPNYKNLSQKKKDAIHAEIMSHMNEVSKHMKAAKSSPNQIKNHIKNAQAGINAIHSAYPELNEFVRKEATTGRGKFGKDSPHAASYLVTSGANGKSPSVEHVDDVDYSGPIPRIAAPKGEKRTLNMKSDKGP